MPSTSEIPPEFHDLLESTAIAFVATIGKLGEPQVTPQWFLFDGEEIRLSIVEGRQKLRNLRRDPRISVLVADPAQPTYYLEVRGRIGDLIADPGLELEKAVATKYTGAWTDVEPDGTVRYATGVEVERITFQRQ